MSSDAYRIPPRAIRGRGTSGNPANRFERIDYVPDPEALNDVEGLADPRRPKTEFYHDLSRSIISTNTSPDLPFDASINPYRGCEHGCAYCYARPTHEYLGWSSGLDFETQILVKRDAPALLRKKLSARTWQPRMLMISGVTDPYQPIERKLRITRGVLEVLAAFRNPLGIITKNHLITRDVDVLADLARHQAANAIISITSLDANLTRKLEPRTAHPELRLAAVRALADAGVPVGVFIAPVIPGLNDREIPDILRASADAGARFAHFIMLRLPLSVAPLFDEWLDTHVPDRKQRVLARVRDMRDGKLNASQFGARFHGKGEYATQIRQLFEIHARNAGLALQSPPLSADAFRKSDPNQLNLFD